MMMDVEVAGGGGIDARHDELDLLLAPFRQASNDARRLLGELRFDAGPRYRVARGSTTGSGGVRQMRPPWVF
ncbi:hypothetical protein GCM10023322_12470 [Rugosimonospora acidiphila]|uniref:Uncharacterized protein n=1 Tax=Rugosimonospora acidiphila TaxID=556531 RepID=A0ABP9RLI7_9ACTN